MLGDDTAPNPSEAVLAALGSCIAVGIHANCVFKGIDLYKLELELEGDINISAVWGTGDLVTEKIVGFSDIRVRPMWKVVHLVRSSMRLFNMPMSGHQLLTR